MYGGFIMPELTYYPLTSPQLSIWYTEKMFPGTSISNVAGTLRIKANINFDLLEQAINLFVKNNEGIRLRICLDGNGKPQQYVTSYEYKSVEIMDFLPYDDPINAMYEWDSQETLKQMEIYDHDLYHFVIIKLSDTDGGFFVNTHHIISDAWSMSLIGNHITNFYSNLTKEYIDNSNIAPAHSYISFINNEQLYEASNRYNKDKIFWEHQFDTSIEATVLKSRKTNLISTKSKRKTFVAPKKFTALLRDYCSQNKISPYPLFLSALAMYIYRVTAKEDILIGTPILNRLNQMYKSTVGMFISTIPLRINVKSEDSFSTFSQDVLELCSSAYRHQRYPYDRILKQVREKHGLIDNLYDIVLSYQNSKFSKTQDIDYSTRWHFNGNQSNSLTIHINDRDDEGVLIIDYDYHSDLYYDKEIDFINQHILSLLWHALDNPNNKICKIEMLPESEKKKVLYDFNNTQEEYPKDKTIHQLFEEQVLKTPDNIALLFEDKHLTYKELNQKSNQLANVLRRKGVGPDIIVGLLVNRSIEMIIGILGIIKAGGAFMTIEPEYPTERIKFMIDESNSKIILSAKNLCPSNILNIEILDIFDESLYNKESTDNLSYGNKSNDLAYLIYTSGSTGLPKGVMVEQKSLHNFICSILKVFRFNEKSIILSTASICFDVFVLEIFPALLNGSKLIIANKDEQKLPFLLSDLIIQNDVTTILTTPAKIKLLINDDHYKQCLSNIKYIMAGGEEFELQLLTKLKELTNAKIINAYGPTEATIAATFKDLSQLKKITIGKPINNTKVYILDNFLNLVPIGIQGELYISGEGLARGYLNNQKLTDQVFIMNPFDNKERLYKTGDIARWYPQGEIEFLGRKDKQVKIRGYRIELTEIENAILQYSGIKDVVVIKKKNDCFGDFICAYFINDHHVNIDINKLKSFLIGQLPRHMIPKFFLNIKAIPINSNGKRDISKLPDINFTQSNNLIVLPSNSIETKLLDLLCKLLKINELSVEENIFENGADSLTVIQLISFLDREGYRLNIEDVYKNPTIRQLSGFIDIGNKTNNIPIKHMTENANYHSKFITIEPKEISELIMQGTLPKIDSAALSYIPNDSKIFTESHKPILYNYMTTSLGNIGVFALPITGMDLYREKENLLLLCAEAIEQAEMLGAKVVSLTGLIPSATNYGKEIIDQINSKIQITTGHATTAASVILSIERLLCESNRDIYNEHIVVLGLGSVGTAVTELLLALYPKIKKITICDIYKKSNYLHKLQQKFKKKFNGDISVIYSEINKLPEEVYKSTLIIGATNVADIIDLNLLQPGTLIIDDSGPHCFSKEQAISRLQKNGDILFTEGGVVNSKVPLYKHIYLPEYISSAILNQYYQHFLSENEITGCILSGLLTEKFYNLSPTIGPVNCDESIKHYHLLKKNQYQGAILHCDDYVIPKEKVELFKLQYGKTLIDEIRREDVYAGI